MKRISLLTLTIIFLQLFNSCSSSFSEEEFDKLNIRIGDVESWLNLMPGGPGSFHVSGKYELPEELDEKKIFLDKIIVTDNEKEIYTLIAELNFVNNSEKEVKEFVFTNPYQTKIHPILMQRDSIEVQLIFSVNDVSVKKELKKILLTRAY
jgi:hypothetical protein